MIPTNQALQRNVQLFPRYKAATSFTPWLPVFFLYFIERVTLADAVLLGSAFYFSVFVLEVPSGYCSDRLGRRPTLILASTLAVIACAIFILADSLGILLLAQVLLASALAFQSGSDSALLYDSLHALGREKEYTKHETVAQKWSMTAVACSCFLGGALGMVDLRLAYALALAAALVAVFHAVSFSEPPVKDDAQAKAFLAQMRDTMAYFSKPLLAWILGFFVLGFSLQHIPYEFYQPYLQLLGESNMIAWLATSSAPMVSGVVIGISMFGGAIGAAVSQALIDRVGLRVLLLSSLGIQVLIVSGMSLLLHPAMLLLIVFRNFSMSMARGPMLGVVAPHVPSAQRATFLSMLSLSGRATFSIVLLTLSTLVIGEHALNWPALSRVLAISAGSGVLVLLILYLRSGRIADQLHLPVQTD